MKIAGAALIMLVLLGSKLVGPANVCSNDAGGNPCNSPQASSANKIPGSAWMREHASIRPL
jgi:hypothetical protein